LLVAAIVGLTLLAPCLAFLLNEPAKSKSAPGCRVVTPLGKRVVPRVCNCDPSEPDWQDSCHCPY
jgi:hypothetical protein